jgi:3-oxoacyl-ACP reductase-like protein
VIALLLACADAPVVEPAAMMLDEPITDTQAEGVAVVLEEVLAEVAEDAPAEVVEPAIQPVDWTESLPAEDQILIGLLNEAVDEAAERTVDELLEQNRIRPSAVPWIGWARDSLKLVFGLGIALLLARTRRTTVDTEAIAEQAAERILGRADVVARESEVGRLAELDKLRQAHAEARSEIARLRQRPATSPALPGLEDPEARRLAVEERGRQALRRR